MIPPIRKPDGTSARSDADKANTLAEHLDNVFKTPQAQGNNNDNDIES